jgi:hypothetical protein
MYSTLKARAKIECGICGCSMNRTRQFKVNAETQESALQEARQRVDAWKSTLQGQSCKICKSILANQ